MPISWGPIIAAGLSSVAGAAGQSHGEGERERLSREERRAAYNLFIQQMMAQDPARLIRMALEGRKRLNMATNLRRATGDPLGELTNTGTRYSQSTQTERELLDALGSLSTYNLSRDPAGGFQYTIPQYAEGTHGYGPAASPPHTPPRQGGGLIDMQGMLDRLRQAAQPASQSPTPSQPPNTGFTSNWPNWTRKRENNYGG